MTTITFGGGPSIEARREFSNLKTGAQVPGYGGYIHQLKYNNGHTYGEQTHILHEKFGGRSQSAYEFQPNQNVSSSLDRFSLRNELPKANGANRLTESMVPGYTGYIPSRKFNFSDTYKTECDTCIDDFLSSKKEKLQKNSSLMNEVMSQNKHNQVTSDHEIKNILDNYADNHPKTAKPLGDKREFTEPPIPGYTGHIPKIVPTSLGLGARYNETTKKGLTKFKDDFIRYSSIRSNTSLDLPSIQGASRDYGVEASKRLFVKPGMIPKYTGYVHGRKFDFGNTYGNSTRDLAVCRHDYRDFGVYMEKFPPKTAQC